MVQRFILVMRLTSKQRNTNYTPSSRANNMENHSLIRERAKKRSEFLDRHKDDIDELHVVGLKLIIQDFGGQTTASETATLVFGEKVSQPAISKALNHGLSAAKIHILLCMAYQELRECAVTTDSWRAIQRAHGMFLRHHQLCEHVATKRAMLYRGIYQTGSIVRIITVDIEGEEHHYSPTELEFY